MPEVKGASLLLGAMDGPLVIDCQDAEKDFEPSEEDCKRPQANSSYSLRYVSSKQHANGHRYNLLPQNRWWDFTGAEQIPHHKELPGFSRQLAEPQGLGRRLVGVLMMQPP